MSQGRHFANMGTHFLLTGMPGSGKTTLVQRVVETLNKTYDLSSFAAGFVTEEIRGPRGRIGFDVVSLSGKRAPLSRIDEGTKQVYSHSATPRPRVGRYLVDVPSFESIALPELVVDRHIKLFVIDEIGKMEFYSESFLDAVQKVLVSDCITLAVAPYFRSNLDIPPENRAQAMGRQFVLALKEKADTRILMVSKENRNGLARVLFRDIKGLLSHVPLKK